MDASKVKNSGGYSLVEVMVAMVISLIVLSGVYKTISDETINAERDEAVLDMQNNARAAMARVAGDIRRAGFFGCGGKESANTTSSPVFDYPPTPIVHANDDTVADADVDDGTDTITLAFLGGDVPVMVDPADLPTSTSGIPLARGAFNNGDTIFVSDCEQYAILAKTNSDNAQTVGHSGANLGRAYGTPLPARVYNFEESIYRVDGANLRLNGDVVASNIEDLQFEFLEDKNKNGDLSDDDGWLEDFDNAGDVRFVKVWVLAMSEPAYTYTDDNTYDYPNSPYYDTTNVDLPAYWKANGDGGSPASQAGLVNDRKHRYRYLASSIIYLRNAGII